MVNYRNTFSVFGISLGRSPGTNRREVFVPQRRNGQLMPPEGPAVDALEIQVFLRIANQRGARDLLREPVLQARDCGRPNANQAAGAEKMSSIQPLAS